MQKNEKLSINVEDVELVNSDEARNISGVTASACCSNHVSDGL